MFKGVLSAQTKVKWCMLLIAPTSFRFAFIMPTISPLTYLSTIILCLG